MFTFPIINTTFYFITYNIYYIYIYISFNDNLHNIC